MGYLHSQREADVMRRSISPTRRLALFMAHSGVCHICGGKITGKAWDVEHIIPFALGGADDESNWAPAHRLCHSPKTVEDVRNIARAKRRKAKHLGIRKRSAFQSKWKRRMDGTVVLR